MISRYDKRQRVINNSEMYSELFEKRDVKFINHFSSPEFAKDAFEDSSDFIFNKHVWKHGDRLYKLAHKYYGSSELWWVIAMVNSKPTESNFSIGDTVLIPTPLSRVLEEFGI